MGRGVGRVCDACCGWEMGQGGFDVLRVEVYGMQVREHGIWKHVICGKAAVVG